MKKDIHVLNWNNITQNINTTSGRLINKGILFENLIEKLLAAMFPKETWRRTIESHDGKRDFVYPYEETLPEQKWAECKNYTSNLYKILYLIFDYPHKHYTFKHFEI